ncbi:peptidase inhibitor family I36 protein [Actinomycetes bacterium KLBMP 9797]
MRRIISVLAVSIVAAAGLMLASSPAAATANSQCPSNKVCLYDGLNWNAGLSGNEDLWSDITANVADLRRYYWHNESGAITGWSMQDDITSIKNRTRCRVYLYRDIDYGGDIFGTAPDFIVRPGEYYGNLGAADRGMNNNITSIRVSC